jgi:electron transfer flavoprotein beta subunit
MGEASPNRPGAVVVALKWVALRPEIDPLSGEIATDPRAMGPSPADRAALEWGFRLAEARRTDCVVVTVAPPGSEPMLRDALACGAASAVRVDADPDDAGLVAEAIGAEARALGASAVLAGDWSPDRGTGAVPPTIAAVLGWPAACGLVGISIEADGTLRLERRLDGGRRHLLTLAQGGAAVLSVEGVTARLRRATLAGTLAAKRAPVETRAAHSRPGAVRRAGVEPYRPRPRILDGPPTSLAPRRRVEVLTGALGERVPPRRLVLEPAAAADCILDHLRAWGELPEQR